MKVEILISSLALINNRNSHIIAHCKCFPPRHSCLCRTGEEGEDGGVVLSKWLLYINMFKTTVMVISLQALIVGMYVMVILYFKNQELGECIFFSNPHRLTYLHTLI